MKIKLVIGQTWISETHPYESFKIYNGTIDTCVDSFKDETLSFEEQPEGCKIFFWERSNKTAFEEFVKSVKGENYDSTYPYAWAGESKKNYLLKKIKKFNMKLQ